MVQSITKLLLKQRMAVYHDFHSGFDATKFLTAKLYSLYAEESEIWKVWSWSWSRTFYLRLRNPCCSSGFPTSGFNQVGYAL